MTRHSKNPNTYIQEHAALEAVLENEGGEVTFPTKQLAFRFRTRCYMYRKLLFKASERSLPNGDLAFTPYDDIQIAVDENIVRFTLKSNQPLDFTTPDGKKIVVDPKASRPNHSIPTTEAGEPDLDLPEDFGDDLAEAAAEFANKLGISKP